jgi:glycosyltransferase involved in cell wall biosynthesis
LDNRTETFIRNFLVEINSVDGLNLNIYQKSKTKTGRNYLAAVTLTNKSYLTKIRDKFFGCWDSQLNRLKRIGINARDLVNIDCIVIDYALNLVDLFKNVGIIDIPVFVFLHGYDASKSFRSKSFIEQFSRLAKKENVYFVSPCQFFINKLLVNFSLANSKFILLPYGVVKPNAEIILQNVPNRVFRFLFVGRFVEKKNPLALVEVVRVLVNELGISNFELVLVGEGPLFKRVSQQIEAYNLQSYIFLRGSLSHMEVMEEMQESHIYVQHSVTDFEGDQEGLPNSILEAIAAGLPVVSTLHSGIPEIVDNGKTGFLVQEFDYIGMAEKLGLLLNDKDLYFAMRNNTVDYASKRLWSNSERVNNFLIRATKLCVNF